MWLFLSIYSIPGSGLEEEAVRKLSKSQPLTANNHLENKVNMDHVYFIFIITKGVNFEIGFPFVPISYFLCCPADLGGR